MLKADSGGRLIQAQQRLLENEKDLNRFTILAVDVSAAHEFDRLRQNKKLKKIGGCDLLKALAASCALIRRRSSGID